MPKKIHPTWYPEAKVICNGELVMTVGSTNQKFMWRFGRVIILFIREPRR